MENLNKNNISIDLKNINPKDLMTVNVLVHNKNGVPAVELRSMTQNENLIKLILSAAYHGIPIIIMPNFRNSLQSLTSCIEKGILIREGNEYYFTF